MHSDVGPSSDSMNATFEGKISVSANYAMKDNRGKMMATEVDLINEVYPSGAFWDYQSSISRIVIEPVLSVKENASYSFDVSEAQDGSVMSYLVANDDKMEGVNRTLYTLYFQANEGIILNEQSGGLFLGFQYLMQIEGIEYLDTSQVINMSYMFKECVSLENLDLSYFETSNVTDMSYMFYGCGSLENLDLSSFNTSNVANMEMMFGGCSTLSTLDVSSFETDQVTNMKYMFSGLSNLQNLDLRNFNFGNELHKKSIFKMMSDSIIITVSNEATKNWILNLSNEDRPTSWTENNITVAT